MERGLQKEIKEAEKHIDDLEQSATKLQTSNGNKAQEFVCVKTAQKNILTVKGYSSKIHLISSTISFYPDMKIKNYLKQLKVLGQVSRNTAYRVKQQRGIDIKEDKKTCRILGSCFTEDGSLLLADHDNKILNRLNRSTDTIIDHVDLEAGPLAVCLTSQQEAAVSLNNKTIQFVSLGNKMTTARKLNMDHYCFGLAFNDGKLFISCANKTVYIYVYLSGTMLHTVTNDKSGNPFFSSNRHITVSTKRDCVCVADRSKGVITLDIEGNYLSTFTDPDLTYPHGVCTDKKGIILVCGCGSSNVMQLSEDSKTKLGSIKTGLRPLSVCFDPHHNKLAVTHDSSTITVYELE